jgi:hypothetical protein
MKPVPGGEAMQYPTSIKMQFRRISHWMFSTAQKPLIMEPIELPLLDALPRGTLNFIIANARPRYEETPQTQTLPLLRP